ncbi:MAG: RNase adapter RapZ [Clostridia bacterium]|nr:RNase adapter RapZ [Clostridia bacterium]
MQYVVVTGLSGAGKSSVIHILEDIGYYCIDNMPPTLVRNFITLCQNSNMSLDKIAFVVDARSGEFIKKLADEIKEIKKSGEHCEVIFLEASDETIIKRYKETRRKHPHSNDGRVIDGIKFERDLLSSIKKKSDYIIDTSRLKSIELREKVISIFDTRKKFESINVTVLSFGFKRGIPLDSDLMLDVRFLPNPFYEEDLKELTGLDKNVKDYVMRTDVAKEFIKKMHDLVEFLLPQYIEEGKAQLVISIGCTGGKHRSVALAEELGVFLKSKNYFATVSHRDIGL